MIKLPLPIDDTLSTYQTCISTVSDTVLKNQLIAIEPNIVAAANAFEQAVQNARLYDLPTQRGGVGGVSVEEMKKIYSYRMVNQSMAGRPIYERLFLAPSNGRCPLCGQRQVATLDHHAPKSLYPALVVTPINLVPSCWDCNLIKRTYTASASEEETLHPYFDDVESDLWLTAEIITIDPISVQYFVNAPSSWTNVKKERVKTHMRIFKLDTLFATEAANELIGIEYYINDMFKAGGGQAVRDHLLGQARSRARAKLNSWIVALYTALATNEWYCFDRYDNTTQA